MKIQTTLVLLLLLVLFLSFLFLLCQLRVNFFFSSEQTFEWH